MKRLTLKTTIFAASSLVLLGLAPVHAGDDAARAEAYFTAITGGDPETITSYYANDAEFRWVGGPLAGLYKGKDKIKGVWKRFTSAAGKFSHEVLELNEISSGTSTVVTAKVRFKGDGDVPVKFAITYRDGKIVSETWQVDKAGVVAKTEPKPETPDAKPELVVQPAPGIRPETIATVQVKPEAIPSEPVAREATPQVVANREADVKVEAKPGAKQAAQPAATEEKPASTAVAAAAPPSTGDADQTAAADQGSQQDYLPKSATSAGKSGKAGSAQAKPAAEAKSPAADAKAAPKAKVVKRGKAPRKRIDIYEDEDNEGSFGYAYGGYRRYDRYYEPRGYYGDYRGYRGYGFGFGYGRYGYGY